MFNVTIGNYVKVLRNSDRVISFMKDYNITKEEMERVRSISDIGESICINGIEITYMG